MGDCVCEGLGGKGGKGDNREERKEERKKERKKERNRIGGWLRL